MFIFHRSRLSILTVLVTAALLVGACSPAAPQTPTLEPSQTTAAQPSATQEPVQEPTGAPTAEPTSESTEAPTQEPTQEPTPGGGEAGGIPARCQVPGAEMIVRQEANFCFAYPADFELLGSGNPMTVMLLGPALDQSLEPVRAGLFLEVFQIDPATTSLDEEAQKFLQQFAGMNVTIQQTPVTFGGQPAFSFEPVPGREGSRDVLFLHNSMLYHFVFTPSVQSFPQAEPDVNELYSAIDQSFTIMNP